MANLALRLQVFIASPRDVQRERECIERVALKLAREVAHQNLLLHVYRFEEDARPEYARPLDHSNRDLRESELVVAILGEGIGSPARQGSKETGTMEELRIAQELVKTGWADDLFLYYRTMPDSDSPVPGLAGFIPQLMDRRSQILWPYSDVHILEQLAERHLRSWLQKWSEIPEICRRAFNSSDLAFQQRIVLGENRLLGILRLFDWDAHCDQTRLLGLAAVQHYQEHGLEATRLPMPCKHGVLSPLTMQHGDDSVMFAHKEVFYFLCGVGLSESIRNNDTSAVDIYPYPNEVHQYLSAIVQRAGDAPALSAVLCKWLAKRTGRGSLSPIARNFAAYVLGMIGARDATEQLADALEHDSGSDVRTYCITSLGKLRSRRHLPLLRRIYRSSNSASEQELIAKAVCRIVGIAHFEL